MKWSVWCITAFLLGAISAANAAESVSVCFNYGCATESVVEFSDAQLKMLANQFAEAHTAPEERFAIRYAIGDMLRWAGEQSPISADKGGNLADQAVYGRMDCIDHATTTTRLLQIIEQHHWLKFHHVLESVRRVRFVVMQHFAAHIEQIKSHKEAEVIDPPLQFVVDSWFFDNGKPAVILPLDEWLAGGGPSVE